MLDPVQPVVYRAALMPLSIVGTVSNLVLICVWCAERYKFNRLIMMVIAGFNILYFISYIVWVTLSQMEHSYSNASYKILFELRLYLAMLYVFLCVMQHFYSGNTFYYHKHPRLVSRCRTICGLLLIGVWSSILNLFNEYVEVKIDISQREMPISGSTMVGLVAPYLLHVYCLVSMVLSYSRDTKLMQTGTLYKKISTGLAFHEPNMCFDSWLLIQAIRHSAKKTVGNLSAVSSVSTGVSSEDPNLKGNARYHKGDIKDNHIFSPQTYKRLKKNCTYEQRVTKSVIAVCILPILAYPIAFSTMMISQFVSMYTLTQIIDPAVDVLQFINANCLLPILVIMLPTFRIALNEKILQIWTQLRDNSSSSDSASNRLGRKTTLVIPDCLLPPFERGEAGSYVIHIHSETGSFTSSSSDTPTEKEVPQDSLTDEGHIMQPSAETNLSAEVEAKQSKKSVSFNKKSVSFVIN